MSTERRTPSRGEARPGTERPAPAAFKRIPLPPLPQFRTRATASAGPATNGEETLARPADREASPNEVSHREVDELIGDAGALSEEPAVAVAERTGATGAAILNDLVDEIEKGLEREPGRPVADPAAVPYRNVIACAVHRDPAPPAVRTPTAPSQDSDRRTGE